MDRRCWYFPAVYVSEQFMLKPYLDICITHIGVRNERSLSIYLYQEIGYVTFIFIPVDQFFCLVSYFSAEIYFWVLRLKFLIEPL